MSNIIQSWKHPSKCSISSTYQNFELLYISKYIQSKAERKYYWQILNPFATGLFLQPPKNIRKPYFVFRGMERDYPTNNYLLKVNNRNTRKRCEICWKLTIKTPQRHQRRRSDVFIINFEHILYLFLVFLLLTLNK